MNRRNPQSTVIYAILILVVFLVANLVGLLKPLEYLVGVALEPVSRAVNVGNDSKLKKENEELTAKVGDLESQLASLQEAKLQNDALRAQLNFVQTTGYQLVHANIISQDPTNYQQFFTIDRGTSSGIERGMTVISQGLLVGRIIETTPTSAKVYLITDYNSAVPVLAQSTRASGIVRGQRGFGLLLDMVPQTEGLQTDDTLITSGFGGDYPKGLVVGRVGEIRKRDAEVYQTAEIRPAVDFRKLESVFIITGTKS